MRYFLIWLLLSTISFVHRTWETVVQLIWRLNGISKKIRATTRGDAKQPAQVLKIVWTNPFVVLLTDQTFFTIHERFSPADIVLNNRMHLLSVNSQKAVFIEVNCDILNIRKHPFMFMALIAHAIRLVVVPIKEFYDLVDSIDVTDREVVWMFHTARCGSTAWSQVFYSLPGWTVFSESQAMSYSVNYGDHGHHSVESFSRTKEFKRMAVAVIKLHIRHAPTGGQIFWKGSVFDEHYVNTISEHFPHHKILMAYRDSFGTLRSFYRSFHSHFVMRYVAEVVMNHDPADDDWWFHIPNTNFFTNGFDHNFCKKLITAVRPRTLIEWFCFTWAAKSSALRTAMQNGVIIKPIKYDSMLRDRRDTIAKVFNYLNIPADLVDVGCETLNHDSQAGVNLVSWESRRKDDATEWSKDEGVVKRCNMILEAFKLPDLHSSLDISNSF